MSPGRRRRAAMALGAAGVVALVAACDTASSSTAAPPATVVTSRPTPAPSATAAASTTAAPAATTSSTSTTTTTPTTTTTVAPPTTPPPPTVPAPPRTSCTSVVHIGDSTSVGMVSDSTIGDPGQRLDARYAAVGVTDFRNEISGARSILERLPGQQNAEEVAERQRDTGYHGCWVLALGTTDAANIAVGSRVSAAERIDRMMAVIGDEPVLWVDVATRVASGPWSNPHMQTWNAELDAATARYPNLHVYDWAAVVQDEWFRHDRIHYTSSAYAERARLIAAALAATYPA